MFGLQLPFVRRQVFEVPLDWERSWCSGRYRGATPPQAATSNLPSPPQVVNLSL
jgi:hypothetical protein